MLVRAVALAPAVRLRSALDEVERRPRARGRPHPGGRRCAPPLAAETPYRWWVEPEMAMAEPMGNGSDHGPESNAEPEETVFRGPGDAGTRKTYPRLDVAGSERPDVVVIDQPFEVTMGLQQRKDTVLVSSSPLVLQVGETVELEVVLLHDPTSIEVTGSPRAHLTVTDLQPYPTVTMTATARYGEELAPERRLGLQLLRDGQVVAVAWRTIVAVDGPERVAGAVVPRAARGRAARPRPPAR